MSRPMQTRVLSPEGFISVNDQSGNEEFRYKTLDYINKFTDEEGTQYSLTENLIVSYSKKRARKDQKDRERLVEKAKKLLENPEKINAAQKRGGRKYIDRIDPAKAETWKLALDKIERDAKFDGYYGIQTSEKNLSATEVMDAYHTLWKIEESFRIMKSTLEVRPVFHWTPKRIHGHFVVCFLAFLMERKMESLLKEEKEEMPSSPQRIQEALNTMQLAAVTANNEEVFIKAKTDPLCKKIFSLLKIDMPANINDKSSLIARFGLGKEPAKVQMSFFPQ
jgi:transposase